MSEQEEGPKQSQFRVVDKRISARGEDAQAADTATPQETRQPPPATPADPVPPQPADPPTAPSTPSAPEAPGQPIWTPEQEAEAQRILHEMAQRPSVDWVVNSAVTLANVAGAKLDAGLAADAQIAIDALAALVEKLGSRLGQAEQPLRQTVAQLQLGYASITGAAAAPPPTTP